MGARTGQQYLESLRERQPEVYLNGERVADVTTHPVFAGPLKSVMEQYDLQHDPRFRDIMLYESPTTGDLVSSGFMVARSREDIGKRRRHFKIRADHHFGTMGRAPDFMNTYALGWLLASDHFAAQNPKYAENARRFYEYVRENDLFLTHVLVNPQADRSRTSANQEDPFLHVGRVRETNEGIIVRGAKMLGTMAPFTEEVLVSPFGGIAPGDDAYALAFSIPSNTKGVKFICRESFAGGDRTLFDHPLSSRFEEMDCVAIFDDVLVPWDRVMVDGSEGSGKIINTLPVDARAGTAVQICARLLASMELMCGVAHRLADAIGITGFLHLQEKMGMMLVQLEQVRTAFHASEEMAIELPNGDWVPYMQGLISASMMAPTMHTQFMDVIHTLAGGGFFYAPSDADFKNAELRPLIDKFVRGRPGISAEQRVALFKLAWDLTGDAFGQRLRQYVKFYSGDPVRNAASYYLNYPKDGLSEVIDRVLAGPGAEVPMPPEKAFVLPKKPTPPPTMSYPAASHPTAPKAKTAEPAGTK